ncbi:MAG: hypothetical protein CFE45_39800, partial [Burkholderiales bacterium PBB5]
MQTAELKPLMQTLAPHKVFGARLQETSYEVCVQDMHWAEAGEIQVFSDRFCLVERAEPPAPGRVRYQVQSAGGEPLRTGLLNILPPESERTIRWEAGHRHAVLCVLEPARLGLVGGTGWDWRRADAANTVD